MSKKKNKKIKIPKNRDIEEMIEQEENNISYMTMEDIVYEIDQKNLQKQKREEFIKGLKQESEKVELEKKIESHNKRIEAQEHDEKRRIELLKAMNKAEKQPSIEEIAIEKEIQEFYREAQRKTDEYIKKYNKNSNEKENQEKVKQKTKKKQNNHKVTGTGNVFCSEEFKKMWEESQKENELDSEER